MKKILSILLIAVMAVGCSLEEVPVSLANENVYSSAGNARAALDGIYQGLAGYEMHGNVYYFLNGLYSGYMVSRRNGQSPTNNPYNSTLGTFDVPSGELNTERVWSQIYVSLGRANDAINSAVVTENPQTADELVINDVVGNAYFVRAFLYFKLVSMWGEVPLRLEPTTPETIHLGISSRKEIFEQIVSDAQKAISLMNGTAGTRFPKVFAANMLLAKVYMSLATAPADVQDGVTNYWQAAYDEAIKVYGQYSLTANYADLFAEQNEGLSESIFELQSSDGASHDWVRAFTPNNYINVNTFGWLNVNADYYDLHAATYPGDPRITATYLSTYTQVSNGVFTTVTKRYPDRTRNNFVNAHPYFYKLSDKNQMSSDQLGNQNMILYRYSELLLMLAEISNELQNGEQLDYVEEVLDRVGLTPQAGYSGTQDDFRHAIFREYQFELLGEGEDCINVRRRGYDWFKETMIDFHNNYALFDANVDVTHLEGEDLMFLPIPDAEINTNQLIGN